MIFKGIINLEKSLKSWVVVLFLFKTAFNNIEMLLCTIFIFLHIGNMVKVRLDLGKVGLGKVR